MQDLKEKFNQSSLYQLDTNQFAANFLGVQARHGSHNGGPEQGSPKLEGDRHAGYRRS
jgi:hypothetical protein